MLTRLHARYGKDEVTDDLGVQAGASRSSAAAEFVATNGKLEEGAREDR